MSAFSSIADAVVALLLAAPFGTFTPAITPVRTWLVDFDLKDLGTLRVSVVPGPLNADLADRGRDENGQYTVDVVVQQKTDASDSQVDAVIGTAEQIFDYLREHDPAASSATSVAWHHTPLIVNEALLTKNVVTSVVTVTYALQR